MKAKRVYIFLFLFIVLCTSAHADSFSRFEYYRNSSDEHLEVSRWISMHFLQQEPILYDKTRCVSISASGQIAVWASPAPNDAYETAVLVYDADGKFKYGYELKETFRRGMYSLFFMNERPCLYYTWVDTIFALDPAGSGILESYTLTNNEATRVLGEFMPSKSYNMVNIDSSSNAEVLDCRNGRLTVINEKGEFLHIYDHSDYNRPVRFRRNLKIGFLILAFFTCAIIVSVKALKRLRKKAN